MMIYTLGAVFLCLSQFIRGAPEDKETLHLFSKFIKDYNRVYPDEAEFNKRLEIFTANLKISEEQQKSERGTARFGITQFSDWTPTEFRRLLGYQKSNTSMESIEKAEIPEGDVPEAHDWRDHGLVTEVKNQGYCGSCWAFAAVGNIEGQLAKHTNKSISLSAQQIVDCDVTSGGCHGGLVKNALEYVQMAGGLQSSEDYVYLAVDRKCNPNSSAFVANIAGYRVLNSRDEDHILRWLHKNGPIAAAVNANSWQSYSSGVHRPNKKTYLESLNHAVLIVGYGVDKESSHPYWLIKNTWGTGWGEDGYIRLYRGEGSCGVNLDITSSYINE